MANIPFKSITFPGLANKYQVPEISNDLMTQGKAADSAKVGAEFDKVKADLDDIQEGIECAIVTPNSGGTNSGVTFEAQNDGTIKAYGTGTGTRRYLCLNGQNTFAVNSTAFNKTLELGRYKIEMSTIGTLSTNISLQYTYSTFASGIVAVSTVTPNATIDFTQAVMLGLTFGSGTNFGTEENPTYISISIKKYTAVDEIARKQFEKIDYIEDATDGLSSNAKMLSFGNSILTGSVAIDGSYDHLSSYENTPYGCIARSLGISKNNVTHTLMDSTGIVHDVGRGSFRTVIKNTDLTGCDYLLTQFSSTDLNDKTIGTLDDTSDSDSLAGAVIDIVNYMKTSNSLCQLILISAPPVSYNYTGRSVFTHVYSGGNNVLELDKLMHELANKYRFLYVDWQGLNLSYYYQDYTDGYNVHANNEETYRTMGDYLAANVMYVQSNFKDKFKSDKAYGMDIVKAQGSFNTNTHNGITFTWDREKQSCTVSGTATARASNNIYSEQKYLPDGINPGDNIIVRFHADSSKVYPRSIFWDDTATEISNTPMTTDIPICVPENAVGWTLRLNVESGNTLTNVHVDRIQAVKIHAKKMDVPLIVSFVDDDTTADQYVTRFHDNCCHNGVVGNFAVITKHIDDGDTTLSKMLDYQDEGFGMLLHCYVQVPDGTNYWTASPRTKTQINQCRANLIQGLQYMRNNGFINYGHWITPGGHHEDELVQIAKQLGFKNLISTQNGRENALQDCDRWFIKRVSLKHDDTSSSMTLAKVKEYIDTAVSNGGGWLIITTHFNEGWKNLTGADAWDDTLDANGYPIGYPRFNEMVQYALSKGMVPMSVPEAWEYYSPILEANYAEVTVAN